MVRSVVTARSVFIQSGGEGAWSASSPRDAQRDAHSLSRLRRLVQFSRVFLVICQEYFCRIQTGEQEKTLLRLFTNDLHLVAHPVGIQWNKNMLKHGFSFLIRCISEMSASTMDRETHCATCRWASTSQSQVSIPREISVKRAALSASSKSVACPIA